MSKVIAIINEKGGTGKSTTTTTLAYLMAKANKKVLVIDFDGQGHSSIICGVNPNQATMTISTLLNKVILDEPLPKPSEYIHKNENGVDVIPANSSLFVLERNLCNVDFREKKLLEVVEPLINQVITKVDEQAEQRKEQLIQSLLKTEPMPQTEDTLERASHMEMLYKTAEELIIAEELFKVQ